ncbi:MAG: hypothetical protein KKG84_04200 [Candidatus Omnitrophica bacterium]|nr:hypothetical protein [Candidatus Omnitrophota bacterium]
MSKNDGKKAIVMVSGGLDSALALKIVADQGINILALHFTSQVHGADSSISIGKAIKNMTEIVGCELRVIRLGREFLEMIEHPKHGYGKNMNPCIDCRIFTLKYARKIMETEDASFVVTGEVIDQRPMSQYRKALATVERESGLEGLLVRPLSGKLLSPTVPEQKGWISRETLLDLHGRNRTPQIELARKFGIKDFTPPAGGCLLTDPGFAGKFKDLRKYGTVDEANMELLKIGRHFRIDPVFKLIVGRDEKENDKLLSLAAENDTIFEPAEDIPGPTGIGRGEPAEKDIEVASRIMAKYIKHTGEKIDIHIRKGLSAEKSIVFAESISDTDLETMRLGKT